MSRKTYEPPQTVEHVECKASPSAGRAQCGVCHKIIAGGSIVTDAPFWNNRDQRHAVRRTFYCDHCNRLQMWIESSTPQGEPTGQVLSKTCGYVRDKRMVAQFLKDNPQAAGVNMAQ